jgi:LPS sulfotransferase NodH
MGRVWREPLGHPCVGFKLCWRQNETIFRAALEDARLKKIVLTRKNRVRAFVSLVRARQTGEWVVYRGAALLGDGIKVEISPAAFLAHVAFNDEYYAEIGRALRAAGQSSLTIDYEDLFSTAERARLLEFLGVSAAAASRLEEHTLRLTTRRLHELVSNYDELAAALRGTEFEAELHT